MSPTLMVATKVCQVFRLWSASTFTFVLLSLIIAIITASLRTVTVVMRKNTVAS